MTAWQTQVARVLAWLLVLPGLWCFWLASVLFRNDGDMLLFVMPLLFCAALGAGLVLTVGSVLLAVQLQQGLEGARLKAAVTGASLAFVGLFSLTVEPVVGLLLVLYGGLLAYCVLARPAAQDLGTWREQVPRQPAPWGSSPGGVWSEQPAQQGPWSPDPRKLPWLSHRGSGPRTPWWEVWRAGWPLLRSAEIAVLLVAGVVFGAGLMASVVQDVRLWGLLAVAAGIAAVWWVERRMRGRLAGQG